MAKARKAARQHLAAVAGRAARAPARASPFRTPSASTPAASSPTSPTPPLGKVWAQPLDPATGWPAGEPRLFLDLVPEGLAPDGAVVDAEGRFWNAQWGAGRVACYDPAGRFLAEERFPARQVSCPAFGGADLATLFVTSAQEGLSDTERAEEPAGGMTFARRVAARGLPEPRVVLG